MPCEPFDFGSGATGFICSRGGRRKRCSVTGCNGYEAKLCDFPLSGRKAGKTCDRSICAQHAHRQGEQTVEGRADTVDYCPAHHEHAQLSLKVGP